MKFLRLIASAVVLATFVGTAAAETIRIGEINSYTLTGIHRSL